ncbi:MAG: TIR domain-containing protein [Blastocatellales bacterium]
MTTSAHNQPDQTNNGARDLFLSYNSRDRELVVRVQELLLKRAIRTFFDRNDLTPGMPWQSELEQAISRVRAVAVLIGGEGIGAWQRPEKELALDRQVQEERAGRRFPVIPVLLPGAEADKVTGFLTRNTWIDLRGGLDNPMAASALDALARAVTDELPVASAPAPEPLCPYRGLEPFHEDDAPLFFGRDKFADDLLQKVLSNPLVAVVGPSGSGKSSVVQAGLLPRLRREGWPNKTWEAVIFTPREHPFHSLAKELLPLYLTDKSKTEQMIEARTLGDALAEAKIPLDDPINEALDAARKIEDADSRSQAMSRIAEVMTKNREADRAKSALDEAERAAQQVTGGASKSERLAAVAEGLAKLHYYKLARETANLCASSSDKLAAYTAILREYYIERHPDQAKLFEEEKPE